MKQSESYTHYPKARSDVEFPQLEQEIRAFWQEQRVFERSVDERAALNADGSTNAYVFYDGPPFANGLPHHGHLLTGYVKDAVARYQTMLGKRVERRFGWDCHGLPAEMEAEKQLGVSGRQQIIAHGVEAFNAHCRTSVMAYRGEWESYVNTQARWVDFHNDYKTMDTPYMESVLWAFKQLHEKGLIYEGFKVMPYSWAAETVLSTSEIRLDDATREKVDKAITVAFKLKERPQGAPEADAYYLLAWTTTPWTLPSNLALAASAEMEYCAFVVDSDPLPTLAGGGRRGAENASAKLGIIGGKDHSSRNPVALEHAKVLRKNPTDAEKTLWNLLKNKQLDHIKFRRQHPIGTYIVDFACLSHQLIIELDGGQHDEITQQTYDAERTVFLEKAGFVVLRFWNNDVLDNPEGVVQTIVQTLENTPLPTSPRTQGEELTARTCYITAQKTEGATIISGSSLIGLSYEPLFPYFSDHAEAFRVLDGSDFIEEGSGTGIVHMAPGFGEDDMRVCANNGIIVLVPVNHEGRYTNTIFDLSHIETDRCILRMPTSDDVDHFIALHTNATVMATVNDGLMTSEQARDTHRENMSEFRTHGYGQWAVFHKETGAFMGRAGISYVAQAEGMPAMPTLRCALMPDFWHGGYGTELCAASLEYGFRVLGYDAIAGGAVAENPRSHAMMERLGMKHIGDRQFKHSMGPYYLIERDAWQGAPDVTIRTLSLKGLNVICETKGKHADEPYTQAQLEKYGLANLRIIQWLKQTEQLIKQEDYTHNYPHCWRTDKPIIYRAQSSWFVDVPKIRDRMVELNQQINWIPDHIKDGRFGKWIAGAREWSISRSRFWGCPIPVWRSDNPNNKELYVFGSIAELEAFFGVKVDDLHKPFIDTLTKPCPLDPQYTIKRVDEVFDCWFESGSMPFAQVHYPFENKAWFEANFPADFIVEYEAQTRGWFYNMMVLSVALFDRIPFKNCICHGVVLDEQGRKLSKKLKNYVNPMELFDSYGSDALRWFMLSSTIMKGNELFLDSQGAFIRDAVRLYIKPLWNAYHFFTLYANADSVKAEYDITSTNMMDRYILSKLTRCVEDVRGAWDAYDTPSVCTHITAFLEVLNNWYIRRNRSRFWGEAVDSDKQAAYNTLYTVLHTLCRVVAPILPQISEAMYAGLVHGGVLDAQHSVHLAEFPTELRDYGADSTMMHAMDKVQEICNTAHALRNELTLRIRQPLANLTVYGVEFGALNDYCATLIADETNVKAVHFSKELEGVANHKLKIHFPIAGKRLGAKMKEVGSAARAGAWARDASGAIIVAGEMLQPDEYDFSLESTIAHGAAALPSQDGLVVLDTTLSDDLIAEGIVRDVVRIVQQSRKDAGFDVSDRISIHLHAEQHIVQAVDQFSVYFCDQTLCVGIEYNAASCAGHKSTHHVMNSEVTLTITRAHTQRANAS
ncbi:MAG: isoleucine--tRNA ligase [Alphaproteobacteria bacterium]|nr:MAG: isoleucine--tRNA ligase [Alphaproteobacteria bacterium]